MVEKTEPTKKIRCLMISESKDIKAFGSTDVGSKMCVLTLQFNDESFKKCDEYRFLSDFVLHFYISDTLDSETVVGVNRFDTCSVSEYNEDKKMIKIKAYNKKFYNMSELKLLRKDKIGSLLSEDDGN
jgi:hypothetical protein